MKDTILSNFTIYRALAVTAVLCGANLAVAKEVTEKIIIRAPYKGIEIKRSNVAHPGLKTEIIELKRFVNIDDLDLTKHTDVIKLNQRIHNLAKESCKKLSEMYPFNPSDLSEMHRCKRKAIASTKKQTERAFAAAH